MTLRVVNAIRHFVSSNVCFSSLDLCLSIERRDANNEFEGRQALGKLLRCLLNDESRTKDDHICYNVESSMAAQDSRSSQLQFLQLTCAAPMPAQDFEAMCSALVTTRTTQKLALELDTDEWDHTTQDHWWKWLAYALFSNRARACSSLETLVICDLGRLTDADVRAFTSVLTSEHPEEKLFGSSRGAIEERDATLPPGVPIRWEFDAEGQPVLDARVVTLDTAIEFVRTFSDDGSSKWVNGLIPGFGRCQVQRCDLNLHDEASATNGQPGISSLTIRFLSEGEPNGAIVPLINSIGSSLKALTLDGPSRAHYGHIDMSAIIEGCPNLLELTIVREIIEVQLDFREYREAEKSVPQLTFACMDVPKFAAYLSDPQHPLTKCVRGLRVSLLRCFVPVADLEAGTAPDFLFYLDAVVNMLKSNERLKFVSVQSPYYRFFSAVKKFHLKPIHRQRKPVPKKRKLALLSVLEPRLLKYG